MNKTEFAHRMEKHIKEFRTEMDMFITELGQRFRDESKTFIQKTFDDLEEVEQ